MVRVGIWTLRLMGPDHATDEENQEAVDDVVERLSDVEQMLSDLVAEGYYIKIEDH
jgi:hypothetical protein